MHKGRQVSIYMEASACAYDSQDYHRNIRDALIDALKKVGGPIASSDLPQHMGIKIGAQAITQAAKRSPAYFVIVGEYSKSKSAKVKGLNHRQMIDLHPHLKAHLHKPLCDGSRAESKCLQASNGR